MKKQEEDTIRIWICEDYAEVSGWAADVVAEQISRKLDSVLGVG